MLIMNEFEEHSSNSLDDVDVAILRGLANDGRKSIAQLAEEVGLTETPCARRVRQLEAADAIRGYNADVNPDAVNLGVAVFVFIHLKGEFNTSFEAFTEAIKVIDAVQSCHFVAGDMDFLLYVRLEHVRDLETFAREQLGTLDMVENFHSTMSIREVFRRPALAF